MKGTKSKLFQRLDLIQKMNGGFLPDKVFIDIFESIKHNIIDFEWQRQKKNFPGNMCGSCLNKANVNCARYCKKFYRKVIDYGLDYIQTIHICKNYVNRKKFYKRLDKDRKV